MRLEHAVLVGLVNLLQDCGRPAQALALIDERLASGLLSDQPWTLLGARAQRVQILSRLGHNEEVLDEAPQVVRQIDRLGEHPGDDLQPPSWMSRELLLETAANAASALQRWDDALRFNRVLGAAERIRGASTYEQAVTRYNRWPALVCLGRFAEAEELLSRLHDVFAEAKRSGPEPLQSRVPPHSRRGPHTRATGPPVCSRHPVHPCRRPELA